MILLDIIADPCWRCGTRADLGCRHHAPHGSLPVAYRRRHREAVDRRTLRTSGQGFNFTGQKAQRLKAELERMKRALLGGY